MSNDEQQESTTERREWLAMPGDVYLLAVNERIVGRVEPSTDYPGLWRTRDGETFTTLGRAKESSEEHHDRFTALLERIGGRTA